MTIDLPTVAVAVVAVVVLGREAERRYRRSRSRAAALRRLAPTVPNARESRRPTSCTVYIRRNWFIEASPELLVTMIDGTRDLEISGYVITTRATWERVTGQRLRDFPQDGAA
jgi:hypothetical protein